MTRREKVIQRIAKGIPRYRRLLEKTCAGPAGMSEADTRTIINDMFADLFGFDKYLEVSAEQRVRGTFVDYVAKIAGKASLVVEAKAAKASLTQAHARQATEYAARSGLDWVLLTNGCQWQLYHVSSRPPNEELVFTVDILDRSSAPKDKAELFYYVSKESLVKNELKDFWRQKVALSAPSIAKILLEDVTVDQVRRRLKAKTGYRVSNSDLRDVLRTDVIKKTLV